jgi:hypothetical protein
MEDNNIKIMHASAALGEANYIKKDSQWKKDSDNWVWRHRDTNYWKELHDSPLQNQKSFYKVFGWFANTVSKGSYREWEFIVSKTLITNIKKLGITFYFNEKKVKMINEPIWFNGITSNYEQNVKIHQGDLPLILNQ